MRALIAACLFAAPTLAAPVPKELRKSARLVGAWELTSMEQAGQVTTPAMIWRFENDRIDSGDALWIVPAPEGVSGISSTGHKDAREGDIAWHDANSLLSPMHCLTNGLAAPIRRRLLPRTACWMS